MNVESDSSASHSMAELNLTGPMDRRADIENKHLRVAEMLKEHQLDGLLIFQPENFAWFTSGAWARGVADEESLPALYIGPEGRWVLASNVDSQRIFDEEIDGLGFQLKEWQWEWGRARLLNDLIPGRKLAIDGVREGLQDWSSWISGERIRLSEYEIACYRAVGQVVSHALEATCRTLHKGETEREIAGQIAHRLIHRGTFPIDITVAADGRSRRYRQSSFTSVSVSNYCVVSATARKYGLCVRASRTVAIGEPDPQLRKEHDAATKISANYVASSWPDAVPRHILSSGERIYQHVGVEHEFHLAPQGWLTGRRPVERMFLPADEGMLPSNAAVTWNASAGAALSCDTYLLLEDEPKAVTPADNWPLKKIRVQGAEFIRPDMLVRD